jgi:hypothetical protein
MSTRTSTKTRRNWLIAIVGVGVALLGVSLTFGPYGLLVARNRMCMGNLCEQRINVRCGWICDLCRRTMAPVGILV